MQPPCPNCGFGKNGEWKPRTARPVKCPRCWHHMQYDKEKSNEGISGRPAVGVKADSDSGNGTRGKVSGVPRRRKVSSLPQAGTGSRPDAINPKGTCGSCGGMNGMHQKGCKR